MPHFLSPILFNFINNAFQNSEYPKSLKKVVLLPIPKNNSSSRDPKDYRPIAIQRTFSKIFEKIMLFQVNYFLSKKSIINMVFDKINPQNLFFLSLMTEYATN